MATNHRREQSMRNCEMKIEGDKLLIEIDLTQDFGPSKSGRTIIIASTQGNVDVRDGIKIGVNCYKGRNLLEG